MENELFALADRLRGLREERDDQERIVKDIIADIEDTEQRLAEAMINSETQNFTRAGCMFCLTTKVRASALAGAKQELFEALKQNGFGDWSAKPSTPTPCRASSRSSWPGTRTPYPLGWTAW